MASVGPTLIKCHEATAMAFARCGSTTASSVPATIPAPAPLALSAPSPLITVFQAGPPDPSSASGIIIIYLVFDNSSSIPMRSTTPISFF
ncbi:hypothetical protein B0H10DRAFT_2212000 [Mycena sp. CBHHK59/15]|nr:hypothetical protein B0H10DRAFT_2212000 [Mycena sp. CBHHK59/15]